MYGEGFSTRIARYSDVPSKSRGTRMRRASRHWNTSPARMCSLMRATPSRNRSREMIDSLVAGGREASRSSGGNAGPVRKR